MGGDLTLEAQVGLWVLVSLDCMCWAPSFRIRSKAVVLKDESSDLVLSIGCSHQLPSADSAPKAKVHLLQGAGE